MTNRFVIDANDAKSFPAAQKELQTIITKPSLSHVPLLVIIAFACLPHYTNQSTIYVTFDRSY
jgi:hypothetical protein